MWKQKFENNYFKRNLIQPSNGELSICKLLIPNGSYRNGVCRALWALTTTWQNFEKFSLQYKAIFHKMMFTFGLRKSKYIWLETIHKRSHLSFLSHSYFSSTVQWPFSKVLSKIFSTKNRFWNSTFFKGSI